MLCSTIDSFSAHRYGCVMASNCVHYEPDFLHSGGLYSVKLNLQKKYLYALTIGILTQMESVYKDK